MSIITTYEQILEEFDLIKTLFESGRKEPFTSINIRRAYLAGPNRNAILSSNTRRRILLGLSVKYIPYPDESEYIAVITLSGYSYWGKTNVRDYVFKIKQDGSFVYNIPFEYSKQSIGKWVKYIGRWLNEIESMSGIRQQLRCRTIEMELKERVFSVIDQLEFFAPCTIIQVLSN